MSSATSGVAAAPAKQCTLRAFRSRYDSNVAMLDAARSRSLARARVPRVCVRVAGDRLHCEHVDIVRARGGMMHIRRKADTHKSVRERRETGSASRRLAIAALLSDSLPSSSLFVLSNVIVPRPDTHPVIHTTRAARHPPIQETTLRALPF